MTTLTHTRRTLGGSPSAMVETKTDMYCYLESVVNNVLNNAIPGTLGRDARKGERCYRREARYVAACFVVENIRKRTTTDVFDIEIVGRRPVGCTSASSCHHSRTTTNGGGQRTTRAHTVRNAIDCTNQVPVPDPYIQYQYQGLMCACWHPFDTYCMYDE